MEPDMLGFRDRISLLLCTPGEVCLRNSLLKFCEEIFVELQDLGYVLLYG